ncbi:MAG: GNAT family N-acyltransferase, partial [Planktomarina sp.]
MAVNPNFQVKLASTPDDLRAAQHLRYNVFVRELGSDGPMVDHEAMIEADSFDGACQHLLLLDCNRGGDVRSQTVGVYRVMNSDGAAQRGGFYSETEFDLSVLTGSGRQLVELGRSCLHPDYRGVLKSYVLNFEGAEISEDDIDENTACLIVQSPDFY